MKAVLLPDGKISFDIFGLNIRGDLQISAYNLSGRKTGVWKVRKSGNSFIIPAANRLSRGVYHYELSGTDNAGKAVKSVFTVSILK